MKRVYIACVLSALLAAGCTGYDTAADASPDANEGGKGGKGGEAVAVSFRMEAAVETDSSLQPMTRAANYKEWLSNDCRLVILKNLDGRWTVDEVRSVPLDDSAPLTQTIKLTGSLPECSFGFEMRPGDYRAVAVINWRSAQWNAGLVPGTVVADENDLSFETPPMLTYFISDHFMNRDLRQLNREVFVAAADFNVPKSGDLHSSGMAPVTLRAERCVTKFRVLLKDKATPQQDFNFSDTEHAAHMVFTSLDKPFPEGIDAMGGMYRGKTPTHRLDWCLSISGPWQTSEKGGYFMSRPYSTVFSPFIFIDPADGDLPVKVSDIVIYSNDVGPIYKTDGVFDRTLAASKVTGLVFETTDTFDFNTDTFKLTIEVAESTDEQGRPEDAAALFDPWYEWNALQH